VSGHKSMKLLMTRRRTVDILDGHRSALALGHPRYVDIIAVVVGKVEHRSGIGCVKNGLKDRT